MKMRKFREIELDEIDIKKIIGEHLEVDPNKVFLRHKETEEFNHDITTSYSAHIRILEEEGGK